MQHNVNQITQLTGRKTIFVALLAIPTIHIFFCKISLSLSFQNGASAIWLSAGLFLGSFLLFGYRIFFGLFPIALIANSVFFYKNDLLTSSLIAICNVGNPFIASILINRFIKNREILTQSQNIFKFFILIIPTPIVFTTFAVATLCIRGIVPWAIYKQVWQGWFTSVIAGILIVTPAMLEWCQKIEQRKTLKGQKISEFLLLIILFIFISYIAFWQGYPLEYMMIPLLIWSAFRFGERESTLLVVIISGIAVFGTVRGFGSFAKLESIEQSLLLLQSFIGVIAITTYVLCAVINENQRAEIKLRKVNEELEYRVEERTHQLEAALKVADKAKIAANNANQAKSEFLANMSHELRTPLNGILGYAQIIKNSELMTDKANKGVDIIYQCASHLLTLINDILDLSKIEARKMELYPVKFHFTSFLQGVVEICRIRAEQKGIEFIYQVDSELPGGVKADEKRLRQVLINLLGNAIKFTDSGSVTFKINLLEAKKEVSNCQVVFEITDTGMGITPEQLDKIFQPFEQVGDVKKQAEGTGLGLAISLKIISLMKSEIKVKSEINQGSTFWFELELPYYDEGHEVSSIAQGKIIGYKGRKQKIIVVDDKWENRSVVDNLLEPIGFEVNQAINGKEALDKINNLQPDVVITDLFMPEIDGFELIKKIRYLSQNMVIIASSASVFETEKYKSLDAGANDFLPKPVQLDSLLKLLARYLKLEWVYEENQQLNTNSSIVNHGTVSEKTEIIPSDEILRNLHSIAKKGDIYAIIDEANKLKDNHGNLTPFAQKLITLAENFQLKPLRKFIKEYL